MESVRIITQCRTLIVMFLFVFLPTQMVAQNEQLNNLRITGEFRQLLNTTTPIDQVRDDNGKLCAILIVKYNFESIFFEMDSTSRLSTKLRIEQREDLENETKLWLSPDEDYIELRKEGNTLYRIELKDKLESMQTYELTLTIEFAILSVNAPKGANVIIDGDTIINNKAIPLIAGYHTVEVKKEGFLAYSERIQIFDGQDIEVDASLERDRSYKVPKKFFVSYSGNLNVSSGESGGSISPLTSGVSIGQLGRTGWYVSARGNSVKGASHIYDGPGWTPDFDSPQYFRFNGVEEVRRLSLTGGLTFQLGKGAFFYVGGGYGVKDLNWQMDTYSYTNDALISSESVKNQDYSYSGVEAEAGLMVRIKYLLLTAGGSTLNFQYANWVVGLGVNF